MPSWMHERMRCPDKILEALISHLALGPTVAMPLLSTLRAGITQKNVPREYNIIPVPLASSPFLIAEPPLSKSAGPIPNQSDGF